MAIPTVRVRTICEVSHTVDGGWDGARRGHPDRAPRAPTTTVTATTTATTTTAANALLSVSDPPHSGSTARTSHTISHRALGRAQPPHAAKIYHSCSAAKILLRGALSLDPIERLSCIGQPMESVDTVEDGRHPCPLALIRVLLGLLELVKVLCNLWAEAGAGACTRAAKRYPPRR